MKLRIGLFVVVVILFIGFVVVEVYCNVDVQGNVMFLDELFEGFEVVEVKLVIIVILLKFQNVWEIEKLCEEVKWEGLVYESVSFVYLENNQVFYSGSGDIQFEVCSIFGLQSGYKYEVILDGQLVGQSVLGLVMVCNVFCGIYNVCVYIVDENGVQVKIGLEISFIVYWLFIVN